MLDTKNISILNGTVPNDRSEWIKLWSALGDKEIMAHPDYVELFSKVTDKTMCATYKDGNCIIMYPFILRPLCHESWTDNSEQCCDTISPYGYGGPFAQECTKDNAALFWSQFQNWALSNNVVSSFVRLSLFDEQLAPFDGIVEHMSSNIVRSLDISEENLWMDYAHKVRKNVKRAKNNDLAVEIDEKGDRLDDFLAIYSETMIRRDANKSYLFEREFYQKIISRLNKGYCFFHILQNGKVISSELVLVSTKNIYSFLGGTISEAFSVRPNDLLKHEVCLWGIRNKKQNFILGGGYSDNDGIYQYKKAFAPSGEYSFKVGKKIYLPEDYKRLNMQKRDFEKRHKLQSNIDSKFFPEYRS